MFSGGDEGGIEAIVVDLGSFHSRIGFAGEDSPRCIISSDVGVASDGSQKLVDPLSSGITSASIENPMDDKGLIEDWSTIETLMEHACKRLSIETSQHPVLLTEPNMNSRRIRERWTEVLFVRIVL